MKKTHFAQNVNLKPGERESVVEKLSINVDPVSVGFKSIILKREYLLKIF